MTELERGVARLLDEAAPAPERVLDPADIRRAHEARRRRARFVVGPALAAAFAAVLAVALASWPHDETTSRTSNGPTRRDNSNHALSAVTTDPRGVTQRVAEQALAELRVPPGARRIVDSDAHGILGPLSKPGSPNLIDRHRIWLANGTATAAATYISAHLPAGMSPDGGASQSGRAGTIATGITLELDRRWQRSGVYDDLEVQVTFTRRGREVGIRADAQAIWLPLRTPSQHVPSTVTSVDVVYHRGPGVDPIRATLTAAVARRLARLVDVATVIAPGNYNCAAGHADDSIMLSFHGPGGDQQATIEPSGCSQLTIGSGPGLNPGPVLLSAIKMALGVR